jgi:hypothetical protein
MQCVQILKLTYKPNGEISINLLALKKKKKFFPSFTVLGNSEGSGAKSFYD